MPTNFTQEERDIFLDKLYAQGNSLLKTLGYKKMKIADIAQSVGIGTGTFYNFFTSKDEYILWLIRKKKYEALDQFMRLSHNFPDGIPRPEMEQYLFTMVSNYNIYHYLNQEEYNHLQAKYDLQKNRDEKIEENAKFIMPRLDTKKPLESFNLFAEAYTIIIIGTSDLTKLNQNYTDKAIRSLIHAACSFIY